MIPGDVVLARVPEGPVVDRKPRPAIVVAKLPSLVPTVLLCGISSRIDNRMDGWDLLLDTDHPDFGPSGLHVPSVIRPSWLASFPDEGLRRLGRVGDETLDALRSRIILALGDASR
jgi:mRNA interferase MazF